MTISLLPANIYLTGARCRQTYEWLSTALSKWWMAEMVKLAKNRKVISQTKKRLPLSSAGLFLLNKHLQLDRNNLI